MSARKTSFLLKKKMSQEILISSIAFCITLFVCVFFYIKYGILKSRFEQQLINSENLENINQTLVDQVEQVKLNNNQLLIEINVEKERLAQAQKMMEEHKDDEQRWMHQFENLANRVIDQQSKSLFQRQSKDMMEILNPLKSKIRDFEEKVEKSNLDAVKRHESLKTQIKFLSEKSEKVSQDANNLAKALKGDFKKQGHWGELILESILDKSGLEKDREYFVQESGKNSEGHTMRPDVVIKLPDNKVMIIDSKVSLAAYSEYVNAESDDIKKEKQRLHHYAMKNHIDSLSTKRYTDLYKIESPDFVLMFVPIDTALSTALEFNSELYNYAFDKNVVIVSSSTLLATLKTVESMWRNDKQNRFAMTIAEEAGKMYDKFAGFLKDMEKLGNQIQTVQNTYQDSMKKLSTGTGNLINRADRIKQLGAKTSKNINKSA